MGLFGFGKKRNKFFSKAKKVEKSSNGLPKIEYFEPTWDDEGEELSGSPLASYRNYLKIPALRFMPWPAIERYNRWTKQWDNVPFINHDCEMAKKYPVVFYSQALPIHGYEDLFYPFSEETIQLMEDIISKLEEINNVKGIRAYAQTHADDEFIVSACEWFLGDYTNCESEREYHNDEIFWNKMKEREIRLYGEKFGYEHPWDKSKKT